MMYWRIELYTVHHRAYGLRQEHELCSMYNNNKFSDSYRYAGLANKKITTNKAEKNKQLK